ncbi:nuclear transport factor 2 family protein [Chelativorans sp.]|uniref:nuclear transport factor 2 family protein n=1 Tax=Chelativorans sp. TaxID=2203393 RepID=UPI0028121676|nr:nuclear transport factor 2 family protein [Chelativorans sp.]
MSEAETRDLVARAFAALNSGDVEALLSCLSEDVALDLPGQGREIGRDRVRWRLAGLSRHFRAAAADLAVMTAPGGLRAAAEFTLRGTYNATLAGLPPAGGQPFRIAAGIFLDVDDDGLISRITACYDASMLVSELSKS